MRESVLHAILLELYKAYNSLDRSRCMDIPEVYGVGPRDLRLPCRYWDQIYMVARARGYY